MLVAFSSSVKFTKVVFPVWNFLQSLTQTLANPAPPVFTKFGICDTKTISISRCYQSLEIGLFYRKLSSRKRRNSLSVFHRNAIQYSNDQRGKLAIDCD